MSMIPKILGAFVAVGIIAPLWVNAQSYVPVKDQELIDLFKTFSGNFDSYVKIFKETFSDTGGEANPANKITKGTSDSIRDLIAGANPGGIASEPCYVGDATDRIFGPSRASDKKAVAFAYDHSAEAYSTSTLTKPSPWRDAIQRAIVQGNTDALPEEFPDPNGPVKNDFEANSPQVNASRSLRCLLQELVEWKKLDLSLNIHKLLKEYISDAQTRQLANQAQSQIAAANVSFAKQGYSVTSEGVTTNAPLLVTNYNNYLYDRKERQVKHLAAQIVADDTNPIGSLGYCDQFATKAAQQVMRESDAFASDPFKETAKETACSMADPSIGVFATEDEYDQFARDPNAVGDGAQGNLLFMLNNPQNAPLTLSDMSTEIAWQRAQDSEENFERNFDAGGGILPTEDGLDDPSANPYDIDQNRRIVSPAKQNEEAFLAPTRNTISQLESADSLDQVPAASTTAANVEVNSPDGVMGANLFPLADAKTAVHDLVKELYDTMWVGYFDLHPYTAEWAQATMLMIYDEMKFNASRPGVIVPYEPGNSVSPSGDTEVPEGF